MTPDVNTYRRFFAEDIQLCSNLKTAALVDALATVPRERFLPAGPWIMKSETDMLSPPRKTPSDDPRFVYHNVAFAIDPARMLFNGAPGLVCTAIDALAMAPGDRALHVGGALGYYTALMAHTVGPAVSISMIEVDESLAGQAATNLRAMPWVNVQHGDGRSVTGGLFNAIWINAGVTHPEPAWLASLAPNGRMALPLTASFGAPSSTTGDSAPPTAAAQAFSSPMANISKGLIVLITRVGDTDEYSARLITFVAIYSAVGLRDAAANAELGRALSRSPFPSLSRFRLDAHEADATCWCHTARGCWGDGPVFPPKIDLGDHFKPRIT